MYVNPCTYIQNKQKKVSYQVDDLMVEGSKWGCLIIFYVFYQLFVINISK